MAIGFEASVGGGVPIIRTLREALAGDRQRAVYGIVNGTCNSILTMMTEQGAEFADALAEAQRTAWPRPIRPSISRATTPRTSSACW